MLRFLKRWWNKQDVPTGNIEDYLISGSIFFDGTYEFNGVTYDDDEFYEFLTNDCGACVQVCLWGNITYHCCTNLCNEEI